MEYEANRKCTILDKCGQPLIQWSTMTDRGNVIFPVLLKGNIGTLLNSLATFNPREDDIWICGYPKSGNHWVYEIVSILLNHKVQVHDQMMENCFMELQVSLEKYNDWPSPRVFVSHVPFDKLPPKVLNKCKIIYPLRNPKSTAVSFYHHMKKYPMVGYKGEFHNFWPLYVEGIADGFLYGDWFTYNKSHWQQCKARANMMVLPYEDLKKDTFATLCKVCDFLNIKRDKSFIEACIRLTSLESLSHHCHRAEHQTISRQNICKLIFRTGLTDDWKNHFTVADNEEFDKLFHERMADVPDLAALIQFQ